LAVKRGLGVDARLGTGKSKQARRLWPKVCWKKAKKMFILKIQLPFGKLWLNKWVAE